MMSLGLMAGPALLSTDAEVEAQERHWVVSLPLEFYQEPCEEAALNLKLVDDEGRLVASFAPALEELRRVRSERRPTALWKPVLKSRRYRLTSEVRDCAGNVQGLPALVIEVAATEARRTIFIDPHVAPGVFKVDLVETCATYKPSTRSDLQTDKLGLHVRNWMTRPWLPCSNAAEGRGQLVAEVEGSLVEVAHLRWPAGQRVAPGESLVLTSEDAEWKSALGNSAERLFLKLELAPQNPSALFVGWHDRVQPFEKIPCCDVAQVDIPRDAFAIQGASMNSVSPDDHSELDRLRFDRTEEAIRHLDHLLWDAVKADTLPKMSNLETAGDVIERLGFRMSNEEVEDAWGTELLVWSDGTNYLVLSAGADRRWGREYAEVFDSELGFDYYRTEFCGGNVDDPGADIVFVLENVCQRPLHERRSSKDRGSLEGNAK